MKVTFRPLQSPKDWDWFKNINPVTRVEDATFIFAVDENDKILAACLMDSWTETSCQAHLVIENPFVLRHGFFEEIFRFIFDEGKRNIMYGITPANNAKALKINKRIGFKEITRLKEAFKRGIDYVLLELRKEDCNFYQGKG